MVSVLTALTSAAVTVGPELQPLVDTISPIFSRLSVVVGGVFGLYVILVVIRVYYERKKVRILQAIRYDMDHLNQHFGLHASSQRLGFWKRLYLKVERGFHSLKEDSHIIRKHKRIKKRKR